MARGFAGLFGEISQVSVVATTSTVSELLQSPVADEGIDLVILDLRLSDASSAGSNIDRLPRAGAQVLAFSGGDDANAMRVAARSGVQGVVLKSEPAAVLLDAVMRAVAGETIASIEWAAA